MPKYWGNKISALGVSPIKWVKNRRHRKKEKKKKEGGNNSQLCTIFNYAKILGKQNFSLGSFPEVGQNQKTERDREKKNERPTVGNNNGQLHIANATSCGTDKPTGPK